MSSLRKEVRLDKNDRIVLRMASLTYADIKNRQWSLDTPAAIELFSSIDRDIVKKIKSSFLSRKISEIDKKIILDYLTSNSDIARIIYEEPSSAEAFEFLYKEETINTPIDKYFIESLAGQHVTKRLVALEKNLLKYISKYFNGRRVLVDNVCSGPGRDMIRMLQNHPEIASKVHVRNIDTNQRALDIGQKAVEELGLFDSFEFIHGDFTRVKPRSADIIILAGVLCTIPMFPSIKLLRILLRYCGEKGIIIYSTNQTVMVEKDPLTDLFMRLSGWRMDYKTNQESREVGELAGWEFVDQFFDDGLHFQCMTVCQKKLNF